MSWTSEENWQTNCASSPHKGIALGNKRKSALEKSKKDDSQNSLLARKITVHPIPKKQILAPEHEGLPGQRHQGTIWALIMFYANRYAIIHQLDCKYISRVCVSLHKTIKSRGGVAVSKHFTLLRDNYADWRLRFPYVLLHLWLNLHVVGPG